MAKGTSQFLRQAMRDGELIRFTRHFEDGFIRGYVVDIGPEFFLLSLVSDSLWFDGFECLRASDVRNLRADPYATFAENALTTRGQRKPKKPHVGLKTVEEILVTANRAFPLVTIHRERVEPDVCHIGRIVDVGNGHLSMLEIGADAKWEDSVCKYRLRQITRIDFGGDYEDALHIVGGRSNKKVVGENRRFL